jgi:pyruvate dehydrogenase E1 component beta subunit
VEEGWKYYGTGQGVAALLYEHAFADLAAPIQHIASADVPLPYAKSLERLALPSKARIVAAARAVLPAAAVS